MERRLFTKADAVLLAALAAAVLLLLLWVFLPRQGTLQAEIITATEAFTVDLSSVKEPYETVIVSNGHTLTLSFEKNAVRVRESDCPDKCCVACGKLTKNGQSAICLPAKVMVRVFASDESEVDAVI